MSILLIEGSGEEWSEWLTPPLWGINSSWKEIIFSMHWNCETVLGTIVRGIVFYCIFIYLKNMADNTQANRNWKQGTRTQISGIKNNIVKKETIFRNHSDYFQSFPERLTSIKPGQPYSTFGMHDNLFISKVFSRPWLTVLFSLFVFHFILIHSFKHLYSTSSRKLLRGVPDSSMVKKNSFQLTIECVW